VSLILHIETATSICSVALSEDHKLVAWRETRNPNSHSELLTVFIEEIFSETGKNLNELDGVCVSKGPGSYTGLRIGVSVAKGLCYALNKPLISVGTLTAMAYGAAEQLPDLDASTLLCPMLDARRMEVYYAIYSHKMDVIHSPAAEIMHENFFADLTEGKQLLLFGDGMEKCKPLFEKNREIHFLDHFLPSAKYMIIPALQKFKNHDFEDVAYFEPFYLKDFIAGKPHVKGLK